MDNTPVLHLLCGKIASGKSTLAAQLGAQPATVVLSEDDWLNALFADQIADVRDYVACAARLRRAMAPHVVDLLGKGVSVVLDFPANTVETRYWMRRLIEETGVAHQMHVIEASNEICLERLAARNAQGDHPFATTEAQFHEISAHFQPPSREEGFVILRHS